MEVPWPSVPAVGAGRRCRLSVACGTIRNVEPEEWEFEADLWEAEGGTWVFATLPPEVTDDVRLLSGPPSGFGSVPVEVTVGATTWTTSVFPDRQRGFVPPVKQAVRRAESLEVGDPARLRLRLRPAGR